MIFIFYIKFQKYNIYDYLYDGTYKILLIIWLLIWWYVLNTINYMMTHILYIIMSWKTNRNIFFEKNIKSLFYWALVLTEDQAFHWKRCKEGVCWKSSYFHLHAPWILTTGYIVKSKQGALDETHLKSAK